ncbi:MAG: oligosaccharide flippase family protein [Bacillota bacterium]
MSTLDTEIRCTATPPRSKAISLKAQALRGSLWTLLGYGTSQVLRLASNLVLARLLFPKAFGLMAIVNVVIQGLQMFSDVGIGPSIIRGQRGEDPRFVNTAWTVQVIRGFALWTCCCVLAWPVAVFYSEPQLVWMLPIAGLTAISGGFRSTSLIILNRNMAVGRLQIYELMGQGFSVLAMVGFAWWFPSVWALVLANVVTSGARSVLSHTVHAGPANRLCWDPSAVRELYSFGRWIFFSTVLTFLCGQMDRLILGHFASIAQLGVYTTALMLSQAPVQVIQAISTKVLFPLYTRLLDRKHDELCCQIAKIRIALMVVSLPALCVLAAWGQRIVSLMYDARYHGAGWIVQVLSMGAIATVIATTMSPVLLATGDSFRFMVVLGTRTGVTLAAMAVGGAMAGTAGIVAGVAASSILAYPAFAWAAHKHGVWMPGIDSAAFATSLLIIMGLWVL